MTNTMKKFTKVMKKYWLLAAIALLGSTLTATSVFAKNGGGFDGPGPSIVTVEQAKAMRDDARVSLKGHIIQNLGNETYLFKDATGTIEVEIDHKVWRGVSVTPEDVVILSGEVDKEWTHTSVDVSTVQKQ